MLPRKPQSRGRPTNRTRETDRALYSVLLTGSTLRAAAKAAGLHVVTVSRWAARDERLQRELHAAERIGAQLRHQARHVYPRPSVA